MAKGQSAKKRRALVSPELPVGHDFFRQWVDRHPAPKWSLMPLTHITKGVVAQKIIDDGEVRTEDCEVFGQKLIYFFYGRPAYKVWGDGAIKQEAACPFCFIFDPDVARSAKAIFAFDTGAFNNRLYKHAILDEMNMADFSLEKDVSRPNRVISAVFSSKAAYMDGGFTGVLSPVQGAESGEFHARAYLQLLASPGRNEPDDRICTMEILHGEAIPLSGNLKAVVVPHTLWHDGYKADWIAKLEADQVEIRPFTFIPGRHSEYYAAQIETVVRTLYTERGWL